KVDWDNIEAWSSGSDYTTPDLKTIVQELVCRGAAANAVCAGDPGDWQSGNAMAFIFTGTGLRQVRTWDRNRATAPILRISFKGTMAEGTVTTAVTVRERLKGIIDQLNHAGWTPIVDTLYEASRYYRGEGLVYGNDRGTDGSTVERNTRVSHNASYTGGTVSRDPGCTDADLNAEDCRTEHINGSPTYISPITDPCATNHIILLTDGEANNNHSASLIRSMASLSSCQTTLSDSSSVIGGESCGVDLAKYINTNDQLLSLAGDQTVTVHTIGFNFSTQFLKDLAHETGGLFKEATTAAELATEIKAIFTDILNRSTSFAAPSLSVNAFNQIFHRNEVFFSLFKPADTIQWIGNVKKYYLCEDSSTGCTVGEILDADMVPAVSDLDGRIMDSARSEWTPVGQMDGAKIEEHGAGGKIPVFASRKVLTYTGTSAPANVSLDMVAHQVQDNNDDGILDGIATGDADVDLQRTKELLGVGGRSITQINANDLDFDLSTVIDAADVTAEKAALAATLNTLIQWILGEDVDDEDANPATTERFAFADPLHSSPVAVIFGGTDAAPIMKLFVGTNDGGLRLINAKNGTEEWIFYPQSTLAKQSGFRANPNGNHEYGIDGTPKSWVYDKDSDGLIEKTDGDFVRILVGMRRGGNFNYAIDVTPAAVPTDPQSVVDIKPTLMWRAEGGSAEFSRLGQTWSQPRHTRIAVGTTTAGEVQLKDVIVFAGGYDDAQDSGFASGGLGNAIYFADASDGTRYLSISADDPGSGEKAIVPDMTYPIPSGVAMLDTNGDDTTNRLYVGDTGGQLWRVDIEPDVSATAGIHTVVGKLATVSGANNAADERKFFYEPDIVQIRDYDYSS
ncbi:MAG: hypothetical protein GY731_00370, partial [Gammaproteobacteria bacterium]|nr:hypothetical protein [Gammaproteobacteria bacterium]